MSKLDESKGEVLSKEEMKSTKGGLGAAAAASQAASQAGFNAPELKTIDASLQGEALSAIPTQTFDVSVNAAPNIPVPPKS